MKTIGNQRNWLIGDTKHRDEVDLVSLGWKRTCERFTHGQFVEIRGHFVEDELQM